MNLRFLTLATFAAALCTAAIAQDANPAPPDNQAPGMQGGYGQRGDGMGMGIGAMAGRGIEGTVTEVAANHYTVKTYDGKTCTVHFGVNTRFMKQPPDERGGRGGGMGLGRGQGRGGQAAGSGRNSGGGQAMGMGMRGGEPIKSSDIKVGDAIAAMGDLDPAGKSVGAMGVFLLDPERAKQMQRMQADYGKTWLMGKVTAVDGVKVTIMGGMDQKPHTFAADENTTFRERRSPITLADIKVGDMVRVEGALKDGAFTATSVNVMRVPAEMPRVPRDTPQ